MESKICVLDKLKETEQVKLALEVLNQNKVISVPTETIYGVAALQTSEGVNNLYSVKQRDPKKPVALCLYDTTQIPTYGKVTVEASLLEELLPGPVTVIFERTEKVAESVNPDTNLIGIRIPTHSFLREVVKELDNGILLTSANISSQPSTLKIEEFQEIWPKLGAIFDGGEIKSSRSGSTVINLAKRGYYKIIREGEALENVENTMKKYNIQKEE